jgi:hypothetical protein
MQVKTLLSEFEKSYHSHFQHSAISAKFSKGIYSSIYIRLYLANDKSELSGGYWDNDILTIIFCIDTATGEFPREIDLESELPNNLVMENSSKHYHIKPPSSMYAYGSRKLSYRKTTGEASKILASFDKFCDGLKKSLQDDLQAENIHPEHVQIVAAKLA